MRRPWDESQITLKRSKIYIVSILSKCDINKYERFTIVLSRCFKEMKTMPAVTGKSQLRLILSSWDADNFSWPLRGQRGTRGGLWQRCYYLKKKQKKQNSCKAVCGEMLKRIFICWKGTPCPRAVSVLLHHTYINKWGQAILKISHYHNNPWRLAARGQWLLSISRRRTKTLFRLVFHFLQTGGRSLEAAEGNLIR